MSICCENPAVLPNYTVCFPPEQLIPGGATEANPYYDFNTQVSYWTYTIEIDPAGPELKDLSNWVLQICPELTLRDLRVEISNDGVTFIPITHIEVLALDPPTQVENVLKINRQQDKGTTVVYRITIHNPLLFNLAAQPGTIAIKAGIGTFLFNENTCLHALPTPSLDCIRVHTPPGPLTLTKRCPKHDTVIYSIGDTININLEITNPGLNDVTSVTVLDLLNIPAGVIIGGVTTDPPAVITPLQVTYTNQDILFTWAGLTIPPGVTSLAISFTILDAPVNITFITNVDAGIESLSGTGIYTCGIAVYHTVQEHRLSCDLQLCLVFNSSAIVDLLIPGYGYCVPAQCNTIPGVCPPLPPALCDSVQAVTWSACNSGMGVNNSKEAELLKKNQPGMSLLNECLSINKVECIRVEKLYDSCFQQELVSRSTTAPFPELSPGQMIDCRIHDFILCEIIEEKDLGSGFTFFVLNIYITLILTDPEHGLVTVLRVINLIKSITLCAPEGTVLNCADSRPINCVCVVIE